MGRSCVRNRPLEALALVLELLPRREFQCLLLSYGRKPFGVSTPRQGFFEG